MTKEQITRFMTLSASLTGSGFILVFFSTSLGHFMADYWLSELGGADTGIYQLRMESYINTFQVLGGVLFGIGLFSLLFTFFKKLTSEKDNYLD